MEILAGDFGQNRNARVATTLFGGHFWKIVTPGVLRRSEIYPADIARVQCLGEVGQGSAAAGLLGATIGAALGGLGGAIVGTMLAARTGYRLLITLQDGRRLLCDLDHKEFCAIRDSVIGSWG